MTATSIEIGYKQKVFLEFEEIIKSVCPSAKKKGFRHTWNKNVYTFDIDGMTLVINRDRQMWTFLLTLTGKDAAKNGQTFDKVTKTSELNYQLYDDDINQKVEAFENVRIALEALIETHNSHHFKSVTLLSGDLDLTNLSTIKKRKGTNNDNRRIISVG